jgi:amino acid transporter
MVGTFLMASIQTLNKVSILGWIGFVSVMAAILTITIAVGIQDRPVTAPQTGPWDKKIFAVNPEGTFLGGMAAVSTVVFSYSGTPAFFTVIGEMRKPQDYNRALYTCQSIVTMTYLTIGIVVYYYCGQYLDNPALGSAGVIVKKVAYGIALPGLFVSVTIYTHVGAKMIFVRVLRYVQLSQSLGSTLMSSGSEHLAGHSFIHWAVWLGIVAGCVFCSFILAEGMWRHPISAHILIFSHPILW